MSKDLITVRFRDYYLNKLTVELDKHIVFESGCSFNNYIYDKIGDKWTIRYPGATRGYIRVDEEEIIQEIVLYDDKYRTDKIYKKNVRDCFDKFIGMKIVIKEMSDAKKEMQKV